MEHVSGGLNSFNTTFSEVGAWPASVGRGGASGAFNRTVLDSRHFSNPNLTAKDVAARGIQSETGSLTYTQTM